MRKLQSFYSGISLLTCPRIEVSSFSCSWKLLKSISLATHDGRELIRVDAWKRARSSSWHSQNSLHNHLWHQHRDSNFNSATRFHMSMIISVQTCTYYKHLWVISLLHIVIWHWTEPMFKSTDWITFPMSTTSSICTDTATSCWLPRHIQLHIYPVIPPTSHPRQQSEFPLCAMVMTWSSLGSAKLYHPVHPSVHPKPCLQFTRNQQAIETSNFK